MKRVKSIKYKGVTYSQSFWEFEDEQKIIEGIIEKIIENNIGQYKRGIGEAITFLLQEIEKEREELRKEKENIKKKCIFSKIFDRL